MGGSTEKKKKCEKNAGETRSNMEKKSAKKPSTDPPQEPASDKRPAQTEAQTSSSSENSKLPAKKDAAKTQKKDTTTNDNSTVQRSKSGRQLRNKKSVGKQPPGAESLSPDTLQQPSSMQGTPNFHTPSDMQETPSCTLSDHDMECPTEMEDPIANPPVAKKKRQAKKKKQPAKSTARPKKKQTKINLEPWQEEKLIEYIREDPRYYDATRTDYKLAKKWDDLARFAATIKLTSKFISVT